MIQREGKRVKETSAAERDNVEESKKNETKTRNKLRKAKKSQMFNHQTIELQGKWCCEQKRRTKRKSIDRQALMLKHQFHSKENKAFSPLFFSWLLEKTVGRNGSRSKTNKKKEREWEKLRQTNGMHQFLLISNSSSFFLPSSFMFLLDILVLFSNSIDFPSREREENIKEMKRETYPFDPLKSLLYKLILIIIVSQRKT